MKSIIFFVLGLFALSIANEVCPVNQCIQMTISQGTGCAWMCNYCANQLGTYDYYFLDGICQYQQGIGCIGNPLAGHTYTCCAV